MGCNQHSDDNHWPHQPEEGKLGLPTGICFLQQSNCYTFKYSLKV